MARPTEELKIGAAWERDCLLYRKLSLISSSGTACEKEQAVPNLPQPKMIMFEMTSLNTEQVTFR